MASVFAAVVRETVGDWTDDQIAAVTGKVRSTSPERLLEDLSAVFAYCALAQKSGDPVAIATVELWQHPKLPIEIMVNDDGSVSHRLDPDVSVEIVH